MPTIQIQVPDIGDFDQVTVIEILVAPGDSIQKEQSLITVESDKASMEIPSSHVGVIKDIHIQLGDKVSEGSVILTVEAASDEASVATQSTNIPAAPPVQAAPVVQVQASAYSGTADMECDVLVLGAGPGGYSAAFRAADLGLKVALVERHATLGGVCLNVGCIPSKALLHVAAVIDEVKHLDKAGIYFDAPKIDIHTLRSHKDKVIAKLTGGLAAMAKARKVTVVQGTGQFVGSQHLQVTDAQGGQKTIAFQRAIIAAGSRAVHLPFCPTTRALSIPPAHWPWQVFPNAC